MGLLVRCHQGVTSRGTITKLSRACMELPGIWHCSPTSVGIFFGTENNVLVDCLASSSEMEHGLRGYLLEADKEIIFGCLEALQRTSAFLGSGIQFPHSY